MRSHSAAAVFLVLCGAASAQTHVPPVTPTPILCPGMAGLEIGFDRALAFQRMQRTEPNKQVVRDVRVIHTPLGRPWTVEVTFDSEAESAKVVRLHYIIRPVAGLIDGILERYKKGTPVPSEPGMSYWEVPNCGVRIRYRMQLSEAQQPMTEEMWVEPLSAALPSGTKGASQPQPKKKPGRAVADKTPTP